MSKLKELKIPEGFVVCGFDVATHYIMNRMRDLDGEGVEDLVSEPIALKFRTTNLESKAKGIFRTRKYTTRINLTFLRTIGNSKKQKLQEKADRMQTELDALNGEIAGMK